MPELKFEKMLAYFKGNRGQRGSIILEDGKTKCRNVCCREGVYAKDIIAEVCSTPDLLIAPVSYPFFALCDKTTLSPVSPYRKMTIEDTKKQYQLRLFVNTGSNGVHFLKMSKATYTYYYRQLKEDFVQDKLFPRATINTAVWMAAIDMAREAREKDKSFSDITKSNREMTRFMPKFLAEKYSKEAEMRQKLEVTFKKFYEVEEFPRDHFVGKYLEVYEKDKMCGQHIYRLKTGRSMVLFLLVVSSRDGIHKTRGDISVDQRGPALCKIEEVLSLKVDLTALTVSLEMEKKDNEILPFNDKKDLVSFCVVVHTYYQLTVDSNAVLLAGDLAPPEECLLIGENDGLRRDICHGPIMPQEVDRVLNKMGGVKSGNYLIRESRNMSNAYTLSLCARGQIYNYRIIRLEGSGQYCFEGPDGGEGHSKFDSLKELIDHYSSVQNGLPCTLRAHICPKVAPIPLMASAAAIPHDNSSSTVSVFVDGSTRHLDFSSTDHSPSSSLPSTPTSSSSPPHHHTQFPHPMTDTSSNYPDSSATSSIQPDSSATSSIQPDSSANSTVPRPSLSSNTAGSSGAAGPDSPDNSGFLTDIVPRRISASKAPVLSGSPRTKLTEELVSRGVTYITFQELKIVGDLGSGNYSQVHLADWTRRDGPIVKVAVKIPTAKPNNVDEVKKELKREIETMASLDHPNIVRLLGISEVQHFLSYIGELPVVIMEFVEGGSLRGHLDHVRRDRSLAKTAHFLLFGKQIAEGMQYLEEKMLVHRDLAARNVLLVKETRQVKISDFGLARQSVPTSKDYAYYIGQNSSNGLPIFWYAPECLRTLRFTTKGDVWSYGVTLWEMFSYGMLPTQVLNKVINNASVKTPQQAFKILADYLENPENCLPRNCNFHHIPAEVYKVMLKCWNNKPTERPSFKELSVTMNALLSLAKRKEQNTTAATS